MKSVHFSIILWSTLLERSKARHPTVLIWWAPRYCPLFLAPPLAVTMTQFPKLVHTFPCISSRIVSVTFNPPSITPVSMLSSVLGSRTLSGQIFGHWWGVGGGGGWKPKTEMQTWPKWVKENNRREVSPCYFHHYQCFVTDSSLSDSLSVGYIHPAQLH